MSYIIYKHTNKINGKVYIGQTIQKAKRRWRGGAGYRNQPIFYNAIKKYGWKNFSHEIIASNIETLDEANKLEEYWISYYHSYIYDSQCNGYNNTAGGNNRDLFGKAVYALTAHKEIICEYKSISEAARICSCSPDRITRCCQQLKGYRTAGNYYWCFVSDYDSYKIKLKHIKKIKILKGRKHKAVIRIAVDGSETFYESVSAAASANNTERTCISHCCKTKNSTLHGYKWRYVDEKRTNEN